MKFIRNKVITFFSIILFVVSCSQSTFFVRTNDVFFNPLQDTKFIKIFIKNKPTKEKFTEIGIIVARGDDIETRYARAKTKARSVGGNALIVLEERDKESSYNTFRTKTGNLTNLRGTNLVYTETTPVIETLSYTEEKFIVIRLIEK